ncbi:TIGR03842 family LLM class F420-dependent oxidoreductase [Pseudonocardiaceae bacterium YIM PH 21723]|nr:TIGR03842 family LLM class F420-dependent oxidoreductase [Pseudonocardiaceae bacterium YIM PH 21723]
MDFGVVLQCDPPASALVDLAVGAEKAGFSHVWTFDSHLLWQEPFVLYSQILAATSAVTVGPMVTCPGTRDATITASLFATLNSSYGNRTVCGVGRGDSAMRTIGLKPGTLAELRDWITVVRGMANGETVEFRDRRLSLDWATGSSLEVWVAAYGPKALALAGEIGDGFILQLADPQIAAWMIGAVREAAERAGRDPQAIRFCVAAPAYVGTDLAHMREQTRWFGGMVGNHVADLVARYGHDGSVPRALTDYIEGRRGYDYAQHGRAGNTHTDFVPDEIVDRFCLLGEPAAHLDRLAELRALGVDQFAVYLQHDAKQQTLDGYATEIIPALR